MANKKFDNIEILLSKLDKEQLSDFIRKECINDGQFQDRFSCDVGALGGFAVSL